MAGRRPERLIAAVGDERAGTRRESPDTGGWTVLDDTSETRVKNVWGSSPPGMCSVAGLEVNTDSAQSEQ